MELAEHVRLDRHKVKHDDDQMCGIFAFCGDPDGIDVTAASRRIAYRGPDDHELEMPAFNVCMGFHRLALVGLDPGSHQPLAHDGMTLICNGMIYNYEELIEEYGLHMHTHNDCEVILHLWRKHKWRTLDLLRGVFAFVLYDRREMEVVFARDPIGIRPMYMGTGRGRVMWASEPIAMAGVVEKIEWVPSGYCGHLSLLESNLAPKLRRWWSVPSVQIFAHTPDERAAVSTQIVQLLRQSIRRRTLGERPLACLLSGGLDSSSVAALLAEAIAPRKLHTFSIGLEGSPDLQHAQMVADKIGSEHTAVIMTFSEMLEIIPEVIRATQTYDITTIRASVPQYLLCKYIAENTEYKIIFNGDCSEEIFASYAYSRFAPSPQAFLEDNRRLITEVYLYDGLRSDRTIAHFGLDARTPFADVDLVEYVMKLDPELKMFGESAHNKIEKGLLRDGMWEMLPVEVASRPKVAFSDGVSMESDSWHDVVRRHFDTTVTDPAGHRFERFGIRSPEAWFYFEQFRELMRGSRVDSLLPTYWMPRFVESADPSARELGKCPAVPATENDSVSTSEE